MTDQLLYVALGFVVFYAATMIGLYIKVNREEAAFERTRL